MLIFYVICAVLIFTASGFIMQVNRLAIYRRRIIRHFAQLNQQSPFILSLDQEKKIKHCFLAGMSIQKCIDQLNQ